jgi:cytosine/adenosine deaminase-related metal-dependent hydrolase
MKHCVLALAVLLSACTSPSGVQVIVGAKLIAGQDQPPVEYSVVIVENGKIREMGPQSSTPVPKGAEITRGNGLTLEPEPGSGAIEVGKPADLVLKGANQDRVMHHGVWVN